MDSPRPLPQSGFSLRRIVSIYQKFEIVVDEEVTETTRKMHVHWDWITGSDRQFDVFLEVQLEPEQSAPERVHVGLVGEFTMDEGVPSTAFRSFVQTAAPAILMPYAREAISSLTGRGPNGAYYLPSINVVRMMKSYDFEATTGAGEFRDNPALAAQYGWSDETEPAFGLGPGSED